MAGAVHPGDRPRFEAELKALSLRKSKRMRKEHPLRDQHGSWRWVAVRGVAEFHTSQNEPTGAVTRIAGSITDQTERKMADPLTGLPNRCISSHLERPMERARVVGEWDFAVLSLAIERFKMVNEGLGYAGGDALLMETASRLTDAMAK